MLRRELVCDLFGTPVLVEMLLHQSPERGVSLEPSTLRTRAARSHERMRGERVISTIAGTVAGQLASDRRHRPPQLRRDRARGLPGPVAVRDDHPLSLAQVPVGIGLALVSPDDGFDDARPGGRDDRAAVLPPVPSLPVDPETPARLRDRHSLLQQLRKRSLLIHHRLPSRTTR